MIKKLFYLNELFDIKKGSRLVQIDRVQGNTPLITAGKKDQGISDYIDKTLTNMDVFEENCITVDMFGNSFFRDYSFCCDDNIHIFRFKKDILPKDLTDVNNRMIHFYFTTIINFSLLSKFGYGRQVRITRIQKEKIELPTKDEKIDFDAITEFMKKNLKGKKIEIIFDYF